MQHAMSLTNYIPLRKKFYSAATATASAATAPPMLRPMVGAAPDEAAEALLFVDVAACVVVAAAVESRVLGTDMLFVGLTMLLELTGIPVLA